MRKPIAKVWQILGKSRKQFDFQLVKTNDVKCQCVANFVNATTQDVEKFWSDFYDQVLRLLDSRKFEFECQNLQICPVTLAEHITFSGSATVNNVLKRGITQTIGNDYNLYCDRFTPETANPFRDRVLAFFYKLEKAE
jgi:DNA-binding ferritin-like protein (Dps family)